MLLSEEQLAIRDTIRAFAQERLAPHAARWDREHHFPRAELRALGELGVPSDRLEEMARKCTERGPIGNFARLGEKDVLAIYRLAGESAGRG